MPSAKPVRRITYREGSKVFVNSEFRKTPRKTREQIKIEKELAKKQRVSKPVDYKSFKISDYAKYSVIEHTFTLLERTRQLIESGKTPIIILPDTSMRIAGHMFGSALMSAFPEVYAPLRKYLFNGVLYLYVSPNMTERYSTPIPDNIKKIVNKVKNPILLVVDESTGHTFEALKYVFGKAFPKVEVKTHGVAETVFNVGVKYIKKELLDGQDKVGYRGHGGVLKKTELGKGKDLPNIIPARPLDYVASDREQDFWNELELKKYFTAFGRLLGLEFRAKLKHKQE